MSADVTRIELAKALKGIKSIPTDEQFTKVQKKFIQEGGNESVMSAVNGSVLDRHRKMQILLQTYADRALKKGGDNE